MQPKLNRRSSASVRHSPRKAPLDPGLVKYVKVSARIRPLLDYEDDQRAILRVLARDNDGDFLMPEAATPPDKLVLCLQTGQHFNNGHKFYQFEPILDKASQ